MNNQILSIPTTGIRKFFPVILPLLFIYLVVSCDDMNDIHQKYYDKGEDIYTGVVDSLTFSAGYERVRFDWEVNADPRITKTVLFWNQRADSVVINVDRTQGGQIPFTHYLSIPEGNYTFELITRDNEGHHSMPTEAIVLVYGANYARFLRNRGIASIEWQPDKSVLIKWEVIANRDIQYANVEYTVNNEQKSVKVYNDEMETILSGLNGEDKLKVFTTYLPANALDRMDSPVREYILPAFEVEINKANFTTVVLAGDNTSVNNNRDLSKIWDKEIANPGILHTVENAEGFNFPHHFTFDMGKSSNLNRFHLWPRTDNAAFTGHSPRYFEIWGTTTLKEAENNEDYWKSDRWKSDWTLLGNHEIIKPETDAEQKAAWAGGWEYPVREDAGEVRYIRLVIKNENWQKSNCVNIGEITLWGD